MSQLAIDQAKLAARQRAMNSIEMRRVSYNTYDLYFGIGWDNRVRIRQGRHGVYVMEGERLPKGLLRELDHTLFNYFPITPGMTLEETCHNLSHITRH